ncbi:RNA recognition motif domain containing protein [Entamoeba histolytica HM-3:IMSS]|uniref:RNA recognition motif domain containing protein n=5 Tax=Entamoeba histolytica TaxID=5759 RepID=C4LV12_ENTH1|nr:RNA recognition motif domain containing protein [Entamoeba histolytica HM-1:IMSS]EMD45786.1 RNA recognition domain containing protein [Entamoeba histolytica KU27]EMS15099.1 RNA recognition motif domain containing protein [Entamoeba histolytica HM-3:IMSS]ENY62305.1 RNA recognition motif domain containing protein [Entamoeba histolytica HM-1:IMSS-A]GAT92483.1 RNA recognition motif domain containing protein [Entamoeba histolytica]EAL50203.1 RNA recognition motif domain containing protein [Entam|eukprot:XP_655589.1 RNA recognition motif domain containing protein [Entamoeba histolytica HM-1:IMSS]
MSDEEHKERRDEEKREMKKIKQKAEGKIKKEGKKLRNTESKKTKEKEEKQEKKIERKGLSREEKEELHKEDQIYRTIFIQNLSFETSEEELKEKMGEYGEVSYCKICMDKEKGISRGTGFVCFRKRGVAEKVIEEAYMFSGSKESDIEIDGRRLILQKAINKEQAQDRSNSKKKKKEGIKDNRNVSLAMVGQKTKEEYLQLGLTPSEAKMRLKAQMERNKKLKNVNFCVNKYRVCVRNIPKNTNKKMIMETFGKYCSKGKISDIKIIKGERGKAIGYCFLTFTSAEDAYQFVEKVNESLQFKEQRRVMVEFSIDDMVKLHKFKAEIERRKFNQEKKKFIEEHSVNNDGKRVKVTSLPKEVIKAEETKDMKKTKKKGINRKIGITKKFNAKKSILL